MTSEVADALRRARVPLVPGMRTDLGRVLEVDGGVARVWCDGAVREIDAGQALPDLDDPATRWLCLGILCERTGLDPQTGALWYRSADGDDAWVLEGTDEVRTRDGDTDDPRLALARALAETAGA